jgi:hypothetical protein
MRPIAGPAAQPLALRGSLFFISRIFGLLYLYEYKKTNTPWITNNLRAYQRKGDAEALNAIGGALTTSPSTRQPS